MKRLIIAYAILSISVVKAQNLEQKNYVQEIEGTSLSFSMQAIPGGEFMMGSSSSSKADEKPVHKVQVDPFWMGTYEVTWDLFESFLYKDFELSKQTQGKVPDEVDAVTRPTKPYLDMTFGMGKDSKPALGMTQYNAIQFCKWLYVRTGVFYRLPTEAEWEYAARAGTSTEYFFGEDVSKLGDYAWFSENSNGQTQQVGKKSPNPYGLFDIYGNVAEWTYDQYIPDFYQQFEGKTVKNPVAEPVELYANTVRGGGFNSDSDDLRSAARMPSSPTWKQIDPQMPKSNWWFPEAPFIGFRLVRPHTQPSAEEIEAYYDKLPIDDFN